MRIVGKGLSILPAGRGVVDRVFGSGQGMAIPVRDGRNIGLFRL